MEYLLLILEFCSVDLFLKQIGFLNTATFIIGILIFSTATFIPFIPTEIFAGIIIIISIIIMCISGEFLITNIIVYLITILIAVFIYKNRKNFYY